jgi:hypothetical protein
MTNWNYQEEYNKLLEALDKDTRPWRPVGLLPEDGTKVYLKCGVDYKGDTRYDVGCYERFSDFWQDQYGEDGKSIQNLAIVKGLLVGNHWRVRNEKLYSSANGRAICAK